MENTPIQSDFFEPLIPYIMTLDRHSGFIEIGLPRDLILDTDIILTYFMEDVLIGWQRGDDLGFPDRVVTGTLKDLQLAEYLYMKWMIEGNTFFTIPDYPDYYTPVTLRSNTATPLFINWISDQKVTQE